MRETKWIAVCDRCQHENIITYAQSWNLRKSDGICRPCKIELGLNKHRPPRASKDTQNKAAQARVGIKRPKSSKVCLYRQLFNPMEFTPEIRSKMAAQKTGKTGEETNRWKKSLTESDKKRNRVLEKRWNREIRKRDGKVCAICKTTEAKIFDVDHIKPWSFFPDLRFDLSNGRVLCRPCHGQTDSYGSKGKKNYAR